MAVLPVLQVGVLPVAETSVSGHAHVRQIVYVVATLLRSKY